MPAPHRHFDPLRPHRWQCIDERYEFTHGTDSVCVYELGSLDFVAEIPTGQRPDCHATSLDNHYLYMACGGDDGGGLYCLDQRTLKVAHVVPTGLVFATNVLPDGDTMLLHDSSGGLQVLRGIQDMGRIRVERRLDLVGTNTWGDTLGGKGHVIDGRQRYLCAGWQHPRLYAVDLRTWEWEVFMDDGALHMGDDLTVTPDGTRAYVACYAGRRQSYVAVVDLRERRVVRQIPTGGGTCGMTMTNDERYVVVSNDADDSISVIDTEADAVVATPCARAAFEALGLQGYIQGISIGANDEVYVYGCSGNGALVRFEDVTGKGTCAVGHAP